MHILESQLQSENVMETRTRTLSINDDERDERNDKGRCTWARYVAVIEDDIDMLEAGRA